MKTFFTVGSLNALNLSTQSFKFFSTSTLVLESNNFNQFLSETEQKLLLTQEELENLGIETPEFNSLKLESGEFKYLHNLKLPEGIMWEGSGIEYENLGEFENIGTIIKNLQSLFNTFNKEQSYSVLFIMESLESCFTLDRQYLVNYNSNVEDIVEALIERFNNIETEKYGYITSDNLVCKYRPLFLKLDKTIIKPKIQRPKSQSRIIPAKYFSYNYLPFTMDLNFYGKILKKTSDNRSTIYVHNNSQLLVTVLEPDCHHKVDVLTPDGSKIKFSFIDEKFENHFIRVILDTSTKKPIFIKFGFNFNILHMEYEIKSTFMPPLSKKELIHNTKILSFDIETYLDEKKNSIPYACGFFDGKNTFTYYSSDFESPRLMLLKCLQAMMDPKYYGYTVYTHNFSSFDCVFLYSLVYSYYKVKFLSKDNHIISMDIHTQDKSKKSKSKLTFRDSARLLPDTLLELGKSFNVPVTKGIFPYSFVNTNNLGYVGSIPSFSFYNQDLGTLLSYTKLFLGFSHSLITSWSLRDETISYLKLDLISLHQILISMSKIIHSNYRLNITNYATLSSLALAIFRSNFMKDDSKLVMLKGVVDKAVRSAYYGGATDVIKPRGFNLFYYDANSLYPTAMLRAMPVGTPIYTTNTNLVEIFGFVHATVTTTNSNIPVLPFKKSDGTLIFPNGTWTGWFFSEELKQAVNLFDYKVEVHESYHFERGYNIFKSYVDTMGSIKQSSIGAKRQIHKLLMNALYGRMGMNLEPELTKVVTCDEARKIHLAYRVIDNFPLTDDLEYIRQSAFPDPDLCAQTGINFSKLKVSKDHTRTEVFSSVPIAAATTAYARMIMNEIKLGYGKNFYYGDTDSAVLDKPLSNKLIGNLLGQFKLEYPKIKEALFVAPKLYFMELRNNEIISRGKGYSGTFSILDYIQLYKGKTVEVIDKRWLKNLRLNTINISNRILKIAPVFNKRNKLYSLGKWVDTSPLCVNPDGTISSLDLVLYRGEPPTILERVLLNYIYRPIYFKLLPASISQSSYIFSSTPVKVSLADVKDKIYPKIHYLLIKAPESNMLSNPYYPLLFHLFQNIIIYIFQDHVIFYYNPPGFSNDIMRNQYYQPVTVKLLHSNLQFFMCMPPLYQKVVDLYYLEGHPLLNEFPQLSNRLFDPRDLRETLREVTQLARNRQK